MNLDIFDREPKYACPIFACVLRFYVFSWNIFHTLTLICFKWVLHMKKHFYVVIPVAFVERSSRLYGIWKNIYKKSTYIILVPRQRYQDFWQLLQNPNVSNHAQRFTPPYYLDVNNPFIKNIKFLLGVYYPNIIMSASQTMCQFHRHWIIV